MIECSDSNELLDDARAAWLKLSLLSHGVSFDQYSQTNASANSSSLTRLNVYNSPVWGDVAFAVPQEMRLSKSVVCAVNVYGTDVWRLRDSDNGYSISSTTGGPTAHAGTIVPLNSYDLRPSLRGVSNLYGGSALAYFTPRACVYFSDGTECRFCSLQGTAKSTGGVPSRLGAETISTNLREVLTYDAARLNQVMIVGGTSRSLDSEFLEYVGIACAVSETLASFGLSEKISIHLAVMPPANLALIDQLKGVANLHVMFNLEVWNETRFQVIAPGKAKHYGRTQILRALDRLVNVVGPFRAHSLLIGGLEPVEVTYAGGRALAERGISVVNNIFHSDKYSHIGLSIRPTTRELRELALRVQDLYSEFPLQPYWKGCGRNAIDYEASLGLFRTPMPSEYP